MPALSSDPVSSSSTSSQETEEGGARSTQETVASLEDLASSELEILESQNAKESTEIDAELEVIPSSQVDPELPEILKEEGDAILEALSNPNSSLSDNVSKSFSSTPGYLANRWNTMHSPFSTPTASQAPPITTPPL
jgi:hypothetical protein